MMASSFTGTPGFSIQSLDSVAILIYDRPQSANSLHPSVTRGLLNALEWAIADPSIKVIVQTGTGKFYTTEANPDEDLKVFREINELLITCEKVLIAAVNGPAVGYGTSSLGLYDLVYSVPDAYFFTPFAKWGLCAEGCSSVTFPAVMGHQKAAALLLAGERMTAQEMYHAGLITKIIPTNSSSQFLEEVLKIAKRIASYPPSSLALIKNQMQGDRKALLLEANAKECEHLKSRMNHDESKNALKSFSIDQKIRKSQKDGRLKHNEAEAKL